MANGQFMVADIPGSFARGQQFRHQAEIRPLEIAAARQSLTGQEQQQQQRGQFSALQNQNLQQQIDQRTDQQKNQSLFNTALMVDGASDEEIIPILERQIGKTQGLGGNADESIRALELAKAGDFKTVREGAKNLINVGVRQGDIEPLPGQQQSSSFREHQALVDIVQNPESTQLEVDSANRALGNLANVGTSAAERIAGSEDLTAQVAASQAEISGAKAEATESKKLEQQLKHKPLITKAVKLAEKEAIERGEVLTDLSRMAAGLPGLKDAVSQLRELSSIATSTIGGKIFDSAVKQTGFGATKGSTARAKMNAIIANQTLPLLKETFGSAFTEAEGARLQASFADPDATHEERLAQLDAFIDQKERTIKTKQAQVQESEGAPQLDGVEMTDANGNRAIVFPDGTFKEL